MTDSEIVKLLHSLEAEVAGLRQISSALTQVITCEGKTDLFSSELSTVSDEVIFLRKKLEKNKSKLDKELDSKIKALSSRLDRLEMDRSRSILELAEKEKELGRIKENLAANALELSKARTYAKAREMELAGYQRRTWELEAEVKKLRRPWWRKLFR
jgi:chromosome segregation ATPase